MSRFTPSVLLFLGLLVAPFAPAPAAEFETAATAAILVDYRNNDVLFAKNPDVPIPPASMSKLMTALVVFDEIKSGRLALDDTLPVSEKAWRMGGSRMFVEVNTRVAVRDLLRGVIVQSGNDACIVLAEALAGSEDAFVARMNDKARELGLENSHFANVSGWPDPEHVMSVRDLATVARTIILDYPEFYELYSIREFEYNGINQLNRNPLLKANVPGVDGMKTGYTSEAGYGLVASAERDGRRLIMVIAGLNSSSQRRSESERLLEYGFRNFHEYRLYEQGETVAEVPVWHGEAASVPLIGEDVIGITLAEADRDRLRARVRYEAPVPAPITAGQRLGEIELMLDGERAAGIPLVAALDVPQAGMLGRMKGTLDYLVWGSGAP
ncbi:MAG: D-alanyl-D-alanine carboxypeptidase [Geminicoccaceae bacterium]|nr:D-alanyl-D-alanine carboxypeptidase [Geminicoccaceae bacterium]